MSDVTIYDVAKLASVSISTVSRVLNSPEQVNQVTRARVQAAIDRLHFVPKAEATARARKGTRRIGVLAPFITYPSFVQRFRGVAAIADASYEMVIYNVESAARRDSYLASLPVLRRLERLRFASLTGRASVALHTRLVDLCEAGDTAAAAEVSHETWQSLGPLLSTLDQATTSAPRPQPHPAEPSGTTAKDDR